MTIDQFSEFADSLGEPNEPEPTIVLGNEEDQKPRTIRAIQRCEAPPLRDIVGTSIDEARRVIATAMRDYMAIPDPDHMLLIPAPPGTGKTWAGVDFAHEQHGISGHRIMYAGPRHNFFEDITEASASQKQETKDWYEWQPRQANDEDAELHTCNHADQINKWLGRGHGGMDFCRQVCGWDYVNNGCPYHAQKKKTNPLIYAQHAHVVLGHPMMDQFEVIIGDENPMNMFIHEWLIPKRWLTPRDMDHAEPLFEVLLDMERLCDRGAKLHGADLMNQLGPKRVVEACQDFTMPLGATVIAPKIRDSGDVDDVGYNYLPELVARLEMEAMAAQGGTQVLERLWLDDRGLTIETRRHVNEHAPKHIIWFDATGTAGLYAQMFGREVEMVDVRPQLTGQIYQVVDRANGKSSLIDKDKQHTPQVEQLKTQIDAIASQFENPAIITFQALMDEFDQPGTHFYGSRGTNSLQGCDCLIVAGTPQPPLFQVEKAAKCLWHKRMRPFDAEWYAKMRRYNFTDKNGDGWEYPTSQYGDPELNEILWQYREAELIQSVHRSRLLFRDIPVYILSNIPVDQLPPTGIITIRELLNAPDGVNAFKWAKIAAWCEGREVVTVSAMIDEFGISRNTVNKYMDIMIEGGEWEHAIVKTGKRGKPPRAISKGHDYRAVT